MIPKDPIKMFRDMGYEILPAPPDGWMKRENSSAPYGYDWYTNGKSLFDSDHKMALVKREVRE